MLRAISCLLWLSTAAATAINRRQVVQSFNPHRNASSTTTPVQVGNGNFAFGVDVTGLQTFSPFNTLSSWGWHNFSLPDTPDFTGLDWCTHGRLVNYNQPNPAENDISTWLIENPQRINLGRIGFYFNGTEVTEDMLEHKSQTLDLWTGKISSNFSYQGSPVKVETWADVDSDTLGVSVESNLLDTGSLGFFFDFPLPTRNKFDAPYVGVFNITADHTTSLLPTRDGADIRHDLGSTSYLLSLRWDGPGEVSGPLNNTHRYEWHPFPGCGKVELAAAFTESAKIDIPSFENIQAASVTWWGSYWSSGAFIDLSKSSSPEALELQRRTILSQYLVAVNSAASDPPQESGLVNNGWYGKFHLEMNMWHLLQFARWNRFPLLWRSTPAMYERYLQSSYDRAKAQGYAGARWGKMTDPTGRSAPGEINSLLIWQQPHAMYFAETEYRSFPNKTTLDNWDKILTATADFMASFAYYNESTRRYDLGPPMYPASENTNPNATVNPAFELAYWRFGLDIAIRWKERQDSSIPAEWVTVRDNLAPLPVANGLLEVYEGIPHMWVDNETMTDHPAMAGIFGLLPPPRSGPPRTLTVRTSPADTSLESWDLADCWGWDFPMLAMNSLRLGDVDQAIAYLLHPLFEFDDAGYPIGGTRVPTPYFPGSSSFLLAMAMMAGGWDGEPGSHFPQDWDVKVEGFVPGL